MSGYFHSLFVVGFLKTGSKGEKIKCPMGTFRCDWLKSPLI